MAFIRFLDQKNLAVGVEGKNAPNPNTIRLKTTNKVRINPPQKMD